jgi:hypothetical protein
VTQSGDPGSVAAGAIAAGEAEPADEYAAPVWSSPRELGSGGAGLASLGQGPVAILAGFDLTTVVLLTTSGGTGALRQAAIACFGVSAALFTLAMAFITSAEDYSATPDDRIMYRPEARVSAAALETERGDQWQDENLLSIYYNYRVTPAVTFAVIGTLAGLILVLLGHDHLLGPDIAAGATALVALGYLADWLKRGGNWWLFPRPVLLSPGQKRTRTSVVARRRIRLQVVRPTLAWQMSPEGYHAMSGEFPEHTGPHPAEPQPAEPHPAEPHPAEPHPAARPEPPPAASEDLQPGQEGGA